MKERVLGIKMKEMEMDMITELKETTECRTDSAVLRKGLYELHERIKKDKELKEGVLN